jgi:hypothetical protein
LSYLFFGAWQTGVAFCLGLMISREKPNLDIDDVEID